MVKKDFEKDYYCRLEISGRVGKEVKMSTNTLQKIQEARDISAYKLLIKVLGEYTTNVPCTGVDELFNTTLRLGAKILPKDKRALDILDYILSCGSTAKIVHKLLNYRFSDLPAEFKPITKQGRKYVVAHWGRGDVIGDKVKDLLDFDDIRKAGSWVDVSGEKITLIDIMDIKEEK